jgi:hypothetical protein
LASIDTLGLAQCTYSIGKHTLSCNPNPGSPGLGASLGPNGLFSGDGSCRDNPSKPCQNSKGLGPIPEGDYDVLPYDGKDPRGFNWWRLRPQSSVRRAMDSMGYGRGGHILHPGQYSLGCITYTAPIADPMGLDYWRIHDLLKHNQPNTLKVTP